MAMFGILTVKGNTPTLPGGDLKVFYCYYLKQYMINPLQGMFWLRLASLISLKHLVIQCFPLPGKFVALTKGCLCFSLNFHLKVISMAAKLWICFLSFILFHWHEHGLVFVFAYLPWTWQFPDRQFLTIIFIQIIQSLIISCSVLLKDILRETEHHPLSSYASKQKQACPWFHFSIQSQYMRSWINEY